MIKCSECGKEYGKEIIACPNCGCPTSESLKVQESVQKGYINNVDDNTKYTKKNDNTKFHKGLVLGIIISFSIVLAFCGGIYIFRSHHGPLSRFSTN